MQSRICKNLPVIAKAIEKLLKVLKLNKTLKVDLKSN